MKKLKFLDYFLQLLMVVMGVYLGMLATNWNANRQLKRNKQDLMLGLSIEMDRNLSYLKSRQTQDQIPFFNSLDSLTKALDEQPSILLEPFQNQSFQERIPNFPGLGRPTLDDAMFEAAKYSNMLANFDIRLLNQLTKTYNLQYNIQETRKNLELKFLQINAATSYNHVLSLMWDVMENYYGAQYNLIREYEQTLTLIEEVKD